MMGFEEDRSANLCSVVCVRHHEVFRPDLIHRPGVGTSLREVGVLTPESHAIGFFDFLRFDV
jgi:hypothetical protein